MWWRMLIVALIVFVTGESYANDKVSLLLEWRRGGGHTGFFLAQKKGYFDEQGIDIEIIPGGGSAKTVAAIANGSVTFGLADGTNVVNAVAQGLPIKFIAAVNNLTNFAVCVRKDRGIEQLKDLEGKTISFTAGTSFAFFFPALLKAYNVDASKVRMVNMDPSAATASVIEGRVDGQLGGVDDQAFLPADKGVPMVILSGADLGLNAIGKGIITSQTVIKNQPDLIRRFLLAVKKGYDDAIADPDAAARSVIEAQDPSAADPLWQLKRMAVVNLTQLMKPPAPGKSYLALDETILTKQIEMMKQFGGLKTDKPLSEFYTHDYLPSN